MTGRIVLDGNEYLNRADAFEISFTKVTDYLLMMKSVVDGLETSWKGVAKNAWVKEFNDCVEKIDANLNLVCGLERNVSDKVMEIYSVYKGIESFMNVFMK